MTDRFAAARERAARDKSNERIAVISECAAAAKEAGASLEVIDAIMMLINRPLPEEKDRWH